MSTPPAHTPVATQGPVLVIGTGLLGTSAALALVRAGVEVYLSDLSEYTRALARDLGAGRLLEETSPDPALVVVATPPDAAAQAVRAALRRYPRAVVTDVSSVKAEVEREVLHGPPGGSSDGDGTEASGEASTEPEVDITRFVGSHPMAGGARTGPTAADADLFVGRPWVVVPHAASAPEAVLTVRTLAGDLGAVPVTMSATEHDEAVALVSHVPQLASSLVAAQLRDAAENALGLAGQGLRDVTRIAASDAKLWSSIVVGNAAPVARVLRAVRSDLDALIAGIERAEQAGPMAEGASGPVARLVQAGAEGQSRIPGKHGGAPGRYGTVVVLVPDEPGELGRLFGEIGEMDINIEDMRLEHAAGMRAGLATISVNPTAVRPLEEGLDARGWRVVAQ